MGPLPAKHVGVGVFSPSGLAPLHLMGQCPSLRSHHPSTPVPRCQAPACCPLTPLHSVSRRRCLAASSARWAPAGSSAELFFILFTTAPALACVMEFHCVPITLWWASSSCSVL